MAEEGDGDSKAKLETMQMDPRFPQQNQAIACLTNYVDYYRCMDVLDGDERCEYLKKLFTTICPNDWIRRWDEKREMGTFPNPIYRVPKDYCEQEAQKRRDRARRKP